MWHKIFHFWHIICTTDSYLASNLFMSLKDHLLPLLRCLKSYLAATKISFFWNVISLFYYNYDIFYLNLVYSFLKTNYLDNSYLRNIGVSTASSKRPIELYCFFNRKTEKKKKTKKKWMLLSSLVPCAQYCSENSSVPSEHLWLSGRVSDWEPEVPGSNPVHGKSPKLFI